MHVTTQPQHFQVSSTFNMDIPDGIQCLGAQPNSSPAIPKANNNYVFRRELMRELITFLTAPQGDGLFISGPTGSGKTSGILETLARLNWPVQQITAHGRLEVTDLIGQYKLVSTAKDQPPTMQFVYGVLPVAMKYGHVLLINELDYADPSAVSGLNDVIEGRPLVITETGGEIIQPHPMFRVIATGNSTGNGDSTGLYGGIRTQNLAFMDRFRISVIGYMKKEDELNLLKQANPKLPEAILESLIKVANAIRKQFLGTDTEAPTMSSTMSTRTLLRWVSLSEKFKSPDINPLKYALEHALTNRCDPSEKIAIEKICEHTLGDQWARGN